MDEKPNKYEECANMVEMIMNYLSAAAEKAKMDFDTWKHVKSDDRETNIAIAKAFNELPVEKRVVILINSFSMVRKDTDILNKIMVKDNATFDITEL